MSADKRPLRGSVWHRRLDFALGVPMLWLLGLGRRRRPLPREIRRVLLLQTAAIGDTLLMAQAIRRVREALPQATIILVLGRDNRGVVPLLPTVDEVVAIDPLRPWATLQRLRALEADVLVDYGPWPRINALLTALSGARFTVGFNTPGQARHFAYDLAVRHSADRHEVENQRALLKFLGEFEAWDVSLVEPPQPAAGSRSSEVVPTLVCHAWASGAGKRLKEWPTEHWIEVAAWASRRGWSIILTGGSSDRADTEALLAAIVQAVPEAKVRSVAGSASLLETAALLRQAAAVVSVNTGLLHLSAFLGAPTVGLHGPTNPTRWGPWGDRSVALIPTRGQCAYLHLGFEFPAGVQPCMPDLSPQSVVAALERLTADPLLR